MLPFFRARLRGRRLNSIGSTGSVGASFSPSDISSLFLDLDSRYGVENSSGSLANDGEVVLYWRDQSGNGHDVEQLTASAQPVLSSSAGPNGLPALDFGHDGVAVKRMETTTVPSKAQPTTYYVVARGPLGSTTHFLYDGLSGRNAIFKSTANFFFFAGSTGGNTGVPTSETWFLDEAYFSGSDSTHRLDNGSKVSSNAGTQTLDQFRIGAGTAGTLAWYGDFARILIFDGLLSAEEEANVRNYLADLYGVSV